MRFLSAARLSGALTTPGMQRGFTLTEMLVACAIAAALLLVALAMAAGTRPGASLSGALVLDAAVTKAQTLAATSGNGATLQFSPYANGTAIRLYRGRPDRANAMAQGAPDAATPASISEQSLGAPPFAVFFDSSGHASAVRGTVDPSTTIASDPGCPAGGSVTLVVSDARAQSQRTLACARP